MFLHWRLRISPKVFLWVLPDLRWGPGLKITPLLSYSGDSWISTSVNIYKIFKRGRTASPKIVTEKRWGRDKEQLVGTLKSLHSIELYM